ncbi:MAG TPA: hypothetical protein VGN11_02905, partial [Candidatus Baltobacteraceae bacterium]|nr:hypothetical protein [Candidatus Baltobacteraceae bacterium]
MASIESDGHAVVENGAGRTVRWTCAASALVAAGLFFVLGNMLGHRPDPAGLLTLEASWVNHGSLVAWWFTWLGYAYVLAPLSAALLIVAWRFPTWRGRIVLSVVLLLVCWRAADFFQHFFARPRRLDWVVKHETAFGYPSSHAAIATGFYLLWSLLASRSDLPGRGWWSALLAGTAIGIMWSRLALG